MGGHLKDFESSLSPCSVTAESEIPYIDEASNCALRDTWSVQLYESNSVTLSDEYKTYKVPWDLLKVVAPAI